MKLTLANTVNPASVTWEHRAASRILKTYRHTQTLLVLRFKSHLSLRRGRWRSHNLIQVKSKMLDFLLESGTVKSQCSERGISDVTAAGHAKDLQLVASATQTDQAFICYLLEAKDTQSSLQKAEAFRHITSPCLHPSLNHTWVLPCKTAYWWWWVLGSVSEGVLMLRHPAELK